MMPVEQQYGSILLQLQHMFCHAEAGVYVALTCMLKRAPLNAADHSLTCTVLPLSKWPPTGLAAAMMDVRAGRLACSRHSKHHHAFEPRLSNFGDVMAAARNALRPLQSQLAAQT